MDESAMMTIKTQKRFTGLWRHPDFMKFWMGQAISQFGSMVTRNVLSLMVILVLAGTPAQLGLLGAAGTASVFLVGLPAGVWVDRMRRRPILITANLGQAVVLGSIPMAAIFGVLHIEQLYVVAGLVGVLTLFFNVANQAFLPTVIGRQRLVEGNSKLGMSDSIAEITASALTGGLVQLLTAPITILLNTLSFLVSTFFLSLLRTPEPPPAPSKQRQRIRRDIAEGWGVVLRNPLLRAMAGTLGIFNLFGGFIGALYGLYAIRELEIEPAVLGVIIACGGVGGFAGALLAGQAVQHFNLGAVLVGAFVIAGGAALLIPIAQGPKIFAVSLLIAGQLVGDMALAIYEINAVSLRQTIIPDQMLGRVNATMQFVAAGVAPIGFLAGGALGQTIGLRPTLVMGALGILSGSLWLIFSPIRALREPPTLEICK